MGLFSLSLLRQQQQQLMMVVVVMLTMLLLLLLLLRPAALMHSCWYHRRRRRRGQKLFFFLRHFMNESRLLLSALDRRILMHYSIEHIATQHSFWVVWMSSFGLIVFLLNCLFKKPSFAETVRTADRQTRGKPRARPGALAGPGTSGGKSRFSSRAHTDHSDFSTRKTFLVP